MQPKRILVAEDELHMRLTLEIIIERLGYMPLFATNGEEALEKLVQNQIDSTPIDLLLCDIQMPGMDGTELIETMRKRLLNLGFNAADAMPNGGEISLMIAENQSMTRVCNCSADRSVYRVVWHCEDENNR